MEKPAVNTDKEMTTETVEEGEKNYIPSAEINTRAELFLNCARIETDPAWKQRFRNYATRLPSGFTYKRGFLSFRKAYQELPLHDLRTTLSLIKSFFARNLHSDQTEVVTYDVPCRADINRWSSIVGPRKRRHFITAYAQRIGQERRWSATDIRIFADWVFQGNLSHAIENSDIIMENGLIAEIAGLDIDNRRYPRNEKIKSMAAATWADLCVPKNSVTLMLPKSGRARGVTRTETSVSCTDD